MSDRPDPASDAPTLAPPAQAADAATLPPDRSPGDTATLPPSPGGRPAPATDPIPGYDILGELGRGGMGVVYRARDTRLNRTVALKMVLAGAHADPRELVRFLAEAEAVAAVEHPHVVRVFGYGDHDGRPYMALEFCDGGSLAGRIVRDGRLSASDAAAVVAAVARGVQAAHDLGIVHRDIKPANVLLTGEGTPKVTDFGLAKRGGGSGLTQTNAVMGTPAYMAPEQAKGLTKFVGPAADIYALGVILYECLAGRPPFEAEDTIALIMKVVEETPPPLSRFVPAVPWDLDVIARKCLAKEPRERYPTAAALADDLGRWARGEPITARPTTGAQRAWMWVRRNKVVAGMVAALLFAMFAGTLVSVAYGVKAGINEQMARDNLDSAVEATRGAKLAEGRAKDALLRGRFEEAKAIRLARQAGWREKALALLGESATLRRDRTGPTPDGLPSLADLRGEAVMALTQRDAIPVREVAVNAAAQTWITPDGGRMFQQHYRRDTAPPRVVFAATDLATGREVELGAANDKPEHAAAVATARAFNVGGTRAVCILGDRGPIQIREFPSGELVATLPEPGVDPAAPADGAVTKHRLQFSPDGRRVLAVRYRKQVAEVVVWDAEKLTPPRVVATHNLPPGESGAEAEDDRASLFSSSFDLYFPSLRFSSDSTRVSFLAQSRKSVRVVDVTADPPSTTDIPASAGDLLAAEWHPTAPTLGLVVETGSISSRVVFWDLTGKRVQATCDCKHEARAERRFMRTAFSPDGRWLAYNPGKSTTVYVYDARTGEEAFRLPDTSGTGGTNHLCWTADGRLITVAELEPLRMWAVADDPPTEVYSRLWPGSRPAFSPDGRRIAVYSATTGRTVPGQEKGEDPGDDGGTGRRIRDRVAILDRRTGVADRYLAASNSLDGIGLRFSRDSTQVVFGRPEEIVVHEAATGREVLHRPPPKSAGRAKWDNSFFLPDGQLIGVLREQQKFSYRLWDVAGDSPAFETLEKFDGMVIVSPEGDRGLVVPPPAFLLDPKEKHEKQLSRLFELPSARHLAEYDPATNSQEFLVTALLSSRARRSLSVGWTVDSGFDAQQTKSLSWVVHEIPSGAEALRRPVSLETRAGDFSPDGRYVGIAAGRGYVEVWDLDAKELVFRWQPHGGKTVKEVTFSSDGDIATVSDEDHRLCVLKLRDVRDRLSKMGLGW